LRGTWTLKHWDGSSRSSLRMNGWGKHERTRPQGQARRSDRGSEGKAHVSVGLTAAERAVLLEITGNPHGFGKENVPAVDGLERKGFVKVTGRNTSSMSGAVTLDIFCRLTPKGKAEQERLREEGSGG
jgi:hypothetical protein